MHRFDRKSLEEVAEILAGLFYAFMAVTLLAVLTASPGTALGLLIVGCCAHVARVGVEGWALIREMDRPPVEDSLRRAEASGPAARVLRRSRGKKRARV
ncbi:MAG TPA: hypothetical protein VF731_13110 [Solirubrobacterales bacterium]